jgi:putative addiction module component (TIGR02574 family)
MNAMGHPAVNLDEFSPEEQLDLLEQIWDRLSQHPAHLPLSDELRAELDRRSADLDEDIRAGRPLGEPWEEVRKRLKPR